MINICLSYLKVHYIADKQLKNCIKWQIELSNYLVYIDTTVWIYWMSFSIMVIGCNPVL